MLGQRFVTLSRVVVWALGISGASQCLKAVVCFWQALVLAGWRTNPPSMAAAERFDLVTTVVAVVVTTTLLIAAIIFVAWFYQAYGSDRLRLADARFARGWAIGAWFLPVLNLTRPPSIARDMLLAGTSPMAGDPEDAVARRRRRALRLAGWWWGFWVLSLAAGVVARAVDTRAGEETLGEFITVGIRALSAHAVVGALTGVAAIFAVLVVRAITERMAAQIVALPVRWRPPLTEGDESDRREAPTV